MHSFVPQTVSNFCIKYSLATKIENNLFYIPNISLHCLKMSNLVCYPFLVLKITTLAKQNLRPITLAPQKNTCFQSSS
uniref:Uncharacterized protein n=1 Tax=Lepeophtheirus salmonis TaxID=72036 RepID=A0A0K2T8Z2_LEPSM